MNEKSGSQRKYEYMNIAFMELVYIDMHKCIGRCWTVGDRHYVPMRLYNIIHIQIWMAWLWICVLH